MTYLLDTSAYSAFNRGDRRLKKWFRADATILIPLIVIGELRAGFAAGSRRTDNEQLLQRFLDTLNVNVVAVTDDTTKHYAELYRQLRLAGMPMGTNDMWIAAHALEHNTQLLTLDTGFSRVPRLKLVKI